ncbi:MAG: transposase zinc-binding domain-containing protein [Verrucomicrobiota bacterium]
MATGFAAHWGRFASMHRHLLFAAHYRAAEAVSLCRTAEFGGQVHDFKYCARMIYVYHSCNHRACPKCGGRE